jgi:hypothetical protein
MQDKSSNGRGNLYWARSGEDGAPFRGPIAPTMTEEEFEERLVRVADPHVDTFDMANEEHRVQYQKVLDRIANGWAVCCFVTREFIKEKNNWIVFIEWVEYFMEDGMPLASHNPMAAMGNGNG